MANSDKNIVITPNIGQTAQPSIVFTGQDAQDITLSVLDNAGLSISGSSGQLFSIIDSAGGTIFSVNDVSGIPSIEVDDDGTIRLAEFAGNVLIGTATDNGTDLLQVDGSVFTAGSINIGDGSVDSRLVIKRVDGTIADDIQFYNGTTRVGEIGTLDTTWLRINNQTAKNIYTPRYIRADGGFYVDGTTYGINGSGVLLSNTGATIGGNTAWHAGNDGSGSGLDADLLDGYHLSTTRNAANTVPVRDANGYLQLGWINTTSGATTSTINKIYASNDDYVRYVTPATLVSQLGLWTSGNDGSGSGLDADTLDGQHASNFAAASHTHNYAGSSSAGGVANDSNSVVYTGYGSGEFTAYQTSSNWQTWTGGWATHLIGNHGNGSTYYNQTIIMPFWGAPQYMRKEGGTNTGPWKFWTEENDGSGSGLDADKLDGQHGSYYAPIASPTFTGTVTAPDFNSTSDIRFKSDIEKIDGALDKVSLINGYTFTMNETEKRSTGVIAQEVEKVLPEAVGGTDDHKTVAYGNMIGLLIEAIKEQQKQIEELKGMIQ